MGDGQDGQSVFMTLIVLDSFGGMKRCATSEAAQCAGWVEGMESCCAGCCGCNEEDEQCLC